MAATHALTMNGRITSVLKDYLRTEDEVLRELTGLLDGAYRFSLLLGALPAGKPFDRIDLKAWPEEFIQCAGNSARLTVELREIVDGVARHWVLGRAHMDTSDARSETVSWADFSTLVLPREIFDGEGAAALFSEYFHTGHISSGVTRRLLERP